jgi:hypothetical protein
MSEHDPNGFRRPEEESDRIPPGAYLRVVVFVAVLVVLTALGTYACDRAG